MKRTILEVALLPLPIAVGIGLFALGWNPLLLLGIGLVWQILGLAAVRAIQE